MTADPTYAGELHDASISRPARRWELVLYRSIRALVHLVCLILGRVTIVGRENVPTEGAFVLAPVHRSNVDFAIASLVTTRRMRYMGKASIWKYALPGRFFYALGAFPVHRGTADRESLRTCIEVIESGQPLVMFPEGTRQSGPLVEHLFDGTAYVAGKTQVPIVPVGIGGSERAMPKGSKMIRPSKLTIVIGTPLPAPSLADSGRVSRRAVRETTEKLHGELQVLFDEAQARAGA